MRTVGIDLSAQPAGTAVCSIEWSGTEANLDRITVGIMSDPHLARM